MAYANGEWARYDHPSNIEFNQIGWKPLNGKGRLPRYAWVKIPNGMWSSNVSCQKANGNPAGCSERLEPSGTQWIQIQFGWSYGERHIATSPTTFAPRYHIPVPNEPAQTGSPCDPPGSFRPAIVGQFTHLPAHEVLSDVINPRTGQPEKNFTKLAVGAACNIPEDLAGAAAKVRDFYTINSDGTYVKSSGWVARMGANGPYFNKEFP